MQVSQLLKNLAAYAGFHVVRNYQNPSHTMMGLLRHGFGTVLDVGANEGQFASWIRTRLPAAELHCFEPIPHAFAQLKKWASLRTNVHAIQMAVGDTPGELEMNQHTEHTTSSSLLATSRRCETLYPFTAAQSKVQVRVVRLDDYVASLPSLPARDWLLKIDVQGFEIPVLRGALLTLSRVRACIIEISLDELYIGQSTFADVVALMSDTGLTYAGNFQQMYDADGHVIFLDAVFVRTGAGDSAQRDA
jgi:FkbM family methyltransferase